MGWCVIWQAVLRIYRLSQSNKQMGFRMDTDKAYARMQEANRIIQDFSMGKYALYALLFLAEIAVCFAVVGSFKG